MAASKSKKKSYIVYEDWARIAVESGDAELALAILAHGIGEETEISNPVSRALFKRIAAQMDENAEKYDRSCEAKAKAKQEYWSKKKHSDTDTTEYTEDTSGVQKSTTVHMIDEKMIDDISPTRGDINARAREPLQKTTPEPVKDACKVTTGNMDLNDIIQDADMRKALVTYIDVRKDIGPYPYGAIAEMLSTASAAEKKYGAGECIKAIKQATEGGWKKIRWEELETARSGTTQRRQNQWTQMENNVYDMDELERKLLEAQ